MLFFFSNQKLSGFLILVFEYPEIPKLRSRSVFSQIPTHAWHAVTRFAAFEAQRAKAEASQVQARVVKKNAGCAPASQFL